MLRSIAMLPVVFALAACAPIQVMTGAPRAPISESHVVVYEQAPLRFEQIALLGATRRSLFRPGGQRTQDKLVKHFISLAAKLGANGIVLDDFTDSTSLSLGTGVGSESVTHNADISLGLGGIFSVYKMTGNVRAIYVPPGEATSSLRREHAVTLASCEEAGDL